MGILERIRALELPADQYIVIGSGLLDVLGLREAGDVDLLASKDLFAKLKQSGKYTHGTKYNEEYLEAEGVEIWLSWGKGNDFEHLKPDCEIIEGIMFISTQFLIDQKQARGTEKDLNDVQLLQRYLNER